MIHYTQDQLIRRIRGFKKGRVLLPSDFRDLGSVAAVNQALSRLTKKGLLIRLGHGVYLDPKVDVELGILYPSIEEIAFAIAKRDKVKIIPTGVYALQKLGISTQVPVKAVFLTDGSPRRIKVGRRSLTFKKTTPKKLKVKGEINQLVIQALSELGINGVNKGVIDKIFAALKGENPAVIKKDALLAPAWISKIMNQYLEKINYG